MGWIRCSFDGLENFRGAILGEQKIWISGCVCCIFAIGNKGSTVVWISCT